MPEETFTLCDFWVPGRPVPWKAAETGRGVGSKGPFRTWKDPALEKWQAHVAKCADEARLIASPSVFWLKIALSFVLTPRSLKNPMWQKPDIGNLEKAVEDALQGIVYVNDGQILQRPHSEVKLCRDPARQGVRVVVETLREEDVWIG